MPVTSDAQDHSTVEIVPGIRPVAPWRVVSVDALEGFRLKVRFVDGLEGLVHMKDLIRSNRAGVFASLRDPAVFAQVHLAMGAVTWPGGIDVAPDAMHDEIERHGEWTPAP